MLRRGRDLGGVGLGRRVELLLVLVERGEVPGEEVLRLELDLTDALAAHAPALTELLQGPRLVLRQPLLNDVPAEVADPLADLRQRLLHVLVLLATEEGVLGTLTRLLEAIEEGRVAVLVDGGIEAEVHHRATLGLATAHLAPIVLQVPGDVRADPPHGVGGEADVLLRVEVLDGLHQADVALLDEVVQPGTAVRELLGDRDHEGEVRERERVAGRRVTLPGAPSELVFLLTGELGAAANLAEVRGKTFGTSC